MKKILIIDDEAISLQILQSSLEKKDYKVITAQDGVEGLFLINSHKPALIILDVHMPNVDGYKLVRDIQSDEEIKKIPIIIVTADEKLEERFKLIGIQYYFKKPYKIQKVLSAIDEILTDRRF